MISCGPPLLRPTANLCIQRKTPASLHLTYMVLKPSHKFPALMQLLERVSPQPARIILFLNTCEAVRYFARVLPAIMPTGFDLVPLHGKLRPETRDKNFARFLTSTRPTVLICTDVAARGLDIPQVDLVVQDPPQNPKTYIHRAGRAGRAGRRGLAIVMLHPGREEDFIHFLDIRKTPVELLSEPIVTVTDAQADRASSKLRALALADRDVFDMSHKALPSFVRSYSKHEASSIFRTQDLDWADLAKQYGMVQLPKMAELKGLDIDRTLGLAIDVKAIPYKDKVRERKRQAAIAEWQAAVESGGIATAKEKAALNKKRNVAWSGKAERAEDRQKRREKKDKKREAARLAGLTQEGKEEQTKLEDLLAQVRAKVRREHAGDKMPPDDDGAFEGFD